MRLVRGVAVVFAAALMLVLAMPDTGVSSEATTRGKAILLEKCGRCHAIETVGESRLKNAPPMRDIYGRFAPRELEAELQEGMVSKHKRMPQIQFSQEDVSAIMAYLYELASRRELVAS